MNTLKLLPILILSMFLISTASAVAVYGDWQGSTQDATITDGQNIMFNTDFISVNPPITLSIKLYDSSSNLIYSFENSKVVNNYSFFNSYELTDAIYKNPGNYEIVLTASDKYYSDSHTLNLKVNDVVTVDTTAPVITLVGASTINLTLGTAYTELGATATDNVDGDVTGKIVITNPVNVFAVGTYTVRYNVKDSAGNSATEVTRTVNVLAAGTDTTAPVITIIGANPMTLTLGTAYIEDGATATDNVDGDITGQITITNSVNIYAIGTYTVLYSVTDKAGNKGNATRIVNVVAGNTTTDTTAPVITLLGTNPISIALGSTYVDAGATAFDNFDGDITSKIIVVNTVDTSAVGTYVITYNVKDNAGNSATEVTRTVGVYNPTDTTAPVIQVISPISNKKYTTTNLVFEVLVDEIAEVQFSLDGGNKTSMDFVGMSGTKLKFTYNATLTKSAHTIVFYATDTAGNNATKTVSFSMDTSKSTSGTKTSSKVITNNDDETEYLKQFEKKQVIYLEQDENTSTEKTSGQKLLNWLIGILIVIVVLLILALISLRR